MTPSQPSQSTSTALSRREAAQIKKAQALHEDALRQQLRECASFAHHGFTRPEDLRELAALSLVLARRLEAM